MIAYKLLTKRKDGSLGPLFIGRKQRIEPGRWYVSESIPTPGYQIRPGWHCAPAPYAPHLTEKGRVWCKVEIGIHYKIKRPKSQGGAWYLSRLMKVIEEV